MKSIQAENYSVSFGDKAYNELLQLIEAEQYSKIIILVDGNTHEFCLPTFLAKSKLPQSLLEVIEIEPGEHHKNIDTCTGVWGALTDLNLDRNTLLINLGGGVVTDMGGFIAATYKRGIKFINVPTTLLSMVDASVGGKTGIDLGVVKNQIGLFVNPELVIIDVDFLTTLPANQMRSGFAEMIKHALIQDKSYWQQLLGLNKLTTNNLEELIYTSVVIKNNIVLKDPKEAGLRKVLNFGHTLGHAIESVFLSHTKPLLHGEAIAIGMILEAYLSHKKLGLSEHHLETLTNYILTYFEKIEFSNQQIDKVLSYLKFDKKNTKNNINFVLLKNIGEPVIDQNVPSALLKESFEYYLAKNS